MSTDELESAVFDSAKKIAIESTSALSVLGSAFIALSYSCHPALRTRPMVILLNLSLMDCGLGLSNLIGILIDFNKYYRNETSSLEGRWTNKNMKILCETQAFFAEFFTISSFLWTSILSVHIYFFLVNHSYQRTKRFGRHLLKFAYLFCYGVPLFVTLWTQFRHHLGKPYNDSVGWCDLTDTITTSRQKTYDKFTAFFAYDLWFFSTVITILVVYISSCNFVRLEYNNSLLLNTKYKEDLKRFQYMFFFIPMVFILLRVWVYLESIFFIYYKRNSVLGFFSLLAGVGDSGQGFANALLFVCFTKDLKSMYKKKCHYFYKISMYQRAVEPLNADTA